MSTLWRPLPLAFGAVALLKGILLWMWGEPPALYDEAAYLATGRVVAEWLRSGDHAELTSLGRLAWHNPGYSLLFPIAELLPGDPRTWLRGIQSLAGLFGGLVLFHTLRRIIDRRWALAGALIFWLHPSMLFYGLVLWPVALTTLGTAVLAFCALRLADDPDSTTRQWEFGVALAPLPFLATPALCLLPGVLGWAGWRRSGRTLGPALLLWLPWMALVSLQLGTFSPMSLSAPRNLALGNHPAIAHDRGSLWGDPDRKAEFQRFLDEHCGAFVEADRVRCEAAWSRNIALFTMGVEPRAAIRRAVIRIGETWTVDQFLTRHLRLLGHGVPGGLIELLWCIHLLLLFAALLGLRTPTGQVVGWAVLLWCLPILLSLGFTRLRQPLLPWLLLAGMLGARTTLESWKTSRTRTL